MATAVRFLVAFVVILGGWWSIGMLTESFACSDGCFMTDEYNDAGATDYRIIGSTVCIEYANTKATKVCAALTDKTGSCGGAGNRMRAVVTTASRCCVKPGALGQNIPAKGKAGTASDETLRVTCSTGGT